MMPTLRSALGSTRALVGTSLLALVLAGCADSSDPEEFADNIKRPVDAANRVELEGALRQVALIQSSFLNETGSYTTDGKKISDAFSAPPNITIEVLSVGENPARYCVRATSKNPPNVLYSETGTASATPCS